MSSLSKTNANDTNLLEQRIKRLEGEYQAVLDAAVDAVIIIDAQGTIELVNHTGERLFGYMEEDLLGRNVNMLMPEPHHAQSGAYIERTFRPNESQLIGVGREVQGRRSDGSMFSADLAVGAIKGSEPPRFVAFIRDITRHKDSQEQLLRSESELNTAQAMANIGNYVIRYDGSGQNYYSPQFCRILGLDPEVIQNDAQMDCIAFIAASADISDRERVTQALRTFEYGATSFDITYRIVRPDSTVRYVHHIAQVKRSAQGVIARHFGTLHDITDRQRSADEAQEMQERLTHFGRISTMGEMAAGIAHEINQPLTAIATYAQGCQRLLANQWANQRANQRANQQENDQANEQTLDSDELAIGLQQIENQALRAGEVIRRLRSFVKNKEVRREPVHPNQLLDDLLMLAQTDTRHHSVRIRIEPGMNLPQVQADTVQIQQVVLNLVRNGIDAMLELPHEQREIVLRTRLIDKGEAGEVGDVEFMVADRGPGLTDTAIEKLFDPFFTTKVGGTGLGLAISHSIVRAHGGKVWYRPGEQGGACFLFSLPAVVVKS